MARHNRVRTISNVRPLRLLGLLATSYLHLNNDNISPRYAVVQQARLDCSPTI